MGDTDRGTDGQLLERTRQETKKPELFKVLLLNDDYTTMEFVVEILEGVFHKQPAEAYRIMMAVHTQGQGLCEERSAERRAEDAVKRAPRQRAGSALSDWSLQGSYSRCSSSVTSPLPAGNGRVRNNI